MIYPDFYPFYATQGSPGFYNEEREQEKEFDLMRSYYPDTARRIQEKAEAQCQLLDYEGSRLYDEYPDRFMLYHICQYIFSYCFVLYSFIQISIITSNAGSFSG